MTNPATGPNSPLTVDGLVNGNTYHARVRAQNSVGWSDWSAWSDDVTPDAETTPVNTVAPAISGEPIIGQQLTADPGDWTGDPSFTYQWTRTTPTDAAATRTTLYNAAASQLEATDTALSPPAYPYYNRPNLGWSTSGATNWRVGFYPSACWAMFAKTGNTVWRDRAITWQNGFSSQNQLDDGINGGMDLGFMFEPYCRGYEQVATDSMRTTVLPAATTIAARWNTAMQAITSWSWWNPATNTIIDMAMNMPLLFWAARNGASDAATLRARAVATLQKIIPAHIRANGSTYHVALYNGTTGEVSGHATNGGLGTETTWARGQAWGMLGFVLCYEEAVLADLTSDAADFLAAAVQMSAYSVANLPTTDYIPWYDFDDPGSNTKDTTAAAIMAYALLKLAEYDTSDDWLGYAKCIMTSLAGSTYQAPAANYLSILRHGCGDFGDPNASDVGVIYSDTYWLRR